MTVIVIPNTNPLCVEAAALLEKEVIHFPAMRLVDLMLEEIPHSLGTLRIHAHSVIVPAAVFTTDVPMVMIRQSDSMTKTMKQIAAIVATVDLRDVAKAQTSQSKIIKPLSNGGELN